MRIRSSRLAATVLGLFGILSLVVQVRRSWLPTESQWSFFGVQAAVLFAFLSFGLGLGPLAAPRPPGGPPEDTVA